MPRACAHLAEVIGRHRPHRRPAQRRGWARSVDGAVAAGGACQAAVIAALPPLGLARHAPRHAPRQGGRQGLYDGPERAAAGRTTLDVAGCFAPRRRRVVRWWRGPDRARAVAATGLGERLAAPGGGLPSRGCATPGARRVRPAGQAGAGMGPLLARLDRLGPAVPPGWPGLVLADRGRRSPRLADHVAARGWRPLRRRPAPAPAGPGPASPARTGPTAGPARCWWSGARGAAAPWPRPTALPPAAVGVRWYGLRAGSELGVRARQGPGWRWGRTRRTDPDRVARPWPAPAGAARWAVADGTRAAAAERPGVPPPNLRVAPPPPPRDDRRRRSGFGRGIGPVRLQPRRARRRWARAWPAPEAWPEPPPDLGTVRVLPPPQVAPA